MAAWKPRSLWSRLAGGLTLLSFSAPGFFLCVLAIFFFSVVLGWLPAAGMYSCLLYTSSQRRRAPLFHGAAPQRMASGIAAFEFNLRKALLGACARSGRKCRDVYKRQVLEAAGQAPT